MSESEFFGTGKNVARWFKNALNNPADNEKSPLQAINLQGVLHVTE